MADAEGHQAAFLAWLKSAGGYVHPSLDLFCPLGADGDRGVVAREDIKEGEQLVLIPQACTLHVPSDQDLKT